MGKIIIAVILVATVLAAPFIFVSQTITQEIVAPPSDGNGGNGGNGVAWRDRTPPQIYDISLCGIAQTTADICWTTNERSTSQVRYWTSPSILSPLDETYVSYHRVQLTNLAPSTTYYYKTMSKDQSGNLRVSEEYTFTTLEKLVKPTPEQEEEEPKPAPPEPKEPEPVKPELKKPEPVVPVTKPPPPEEPAEAKLPWELVVGIFGGFAVIAGGMFYWLRRRKGQKEAN